MAAPAIASQPASAVRLEHRTNRTVESGSPFPLGATPVADGVNFALYSKNAAEVFLLLFDSPDGQPTDMIQLRDRDKFIWHARVQGLIPGQLYGYKVRGDYRPESGLLFNDSKLLLDPYARALTGKFRNTDNLLLAYDAQPAAGELFPDTRDNTAIVPKSIVVDDAFDWQGVSSPTSRTRRAHHLRGPPQRLHCPRFFGRPLPRDLSRLCREDPVPASSG